MHHNKKQHHMGACVSKMTRMSSCGRRRSTCIFVAEYKYMCGVVHVYLLPSTSYVFSKMMRKSTCTDVVGGKGHEMQHKHRQALQHPCANQ